MKYFPGVVGPSSYGRQPATVPSTGSVSRLTLFVSGT
jgi:hypothetical protein